MAETSPQHARLLRWAQIFFFFSGATGLVYQVLWTRRLTLTFGHSVLAISTVLTVFMGGLALGSYLAGLWVDSRPQERPQVDFLRDYARLEGFIGLWALLSLPLLELAEALYLVAAEANLAGTQLQLVCFAGAALVLLAPTTAMGATVPLLARLLTIQSQQVGAILSRLYGLNTLGALSGAALSGFLLLPTIGLTASMVGAALINLAIAGGAYREAGQAGDLSSEPEPKQKKSKKSKKKSRGEQASAEPPPPYSLWIVPLTFALGGVASLSYQVSWNRSICLAIGSSVYAFSTILVAFLGGLGLGSLVYQRVFRDTPPRLSHLGWLYLAIALTGGATEALLPLLPHAFLALFPLAGDSFSVIIVINLLLCLGLLFVPTLLMGLGFPLATALYTTSLGSLGRSVGSVYSANTLGCIVGSFATGFVLLPTIGAQWSLKLATLLYLAAAATVFLARGSNLVQRMTTVMVVGVLCLMMPRWDKSLFSAGAAVYAGLDGGLIRSHPVVYLDGLSATVSFHLDGEYWEVPRMRVNGKVDASWGKGDRLTQYMLGYLPVLNHPNPERVGIIGLGGGFTVEAVAQAPGVKSIEVAELEPAVLTVAEYWKPFNGRVLEDPRVKVKVLDGRTFVLASQKKFDVLISEPSNPWIAGIGNLFTRDFYATAKERLQDDGVMCQWFNLYAVSTEDMKMVVRGFFDVFPYGQVWQSNGGDMILIGSQQPTLFDLERIRKAWQGSLSIQRHFFEAAIYYPEALVGHYLMDREMALDMAGEGPFNSDDRPLLEFSAPFSLYSPDANHDNTELLRKNALPGTLNAQIDEQTRRRSLYGSLNIENYPHLREELEKDQARYPAAFDLAALMKAELEPDATESQRNIYRGCLGKFPNQSSLTAYHWAELEYQNNNLEKAADLYLTALLDPPPGSEAHLYKMLGLTLVHMEDYLRAIPALERATQRDLTHSTAMATLGGALVAIEQNEKALEVLEKAFERNPHDPTIFQNRAYAYFNSGDPQKAARELERFVELVPDYPPIWNKLGLCRKVLGDRAGAREAFERCLELAPNDTTAANELRDL